MASVTPRRTSIAAAIGVLVVAMVVMLAHGCGASRTTHPPTAPTLAQRTPARITPKMALKQAVVCVGRDGQVARTPTRRDLDRMKRQAHKVKKGTERKTPRRSMPGELKLHRLPNGTYAGTCLYGTGSTGRGNY
jgi:hypothetical protein